MSIRERLEALVQQAISTATQKYISRSTGDIEEEVILAISHCFHGACKNPSFSSKDLIVIESVIDRVWERLNTGRWQEVPSFLRELYAYSSYMKVLLILKRTLDQTDDEILENLTEAVKAVDMGLLLGSSLREELTEIAAILCSFIFAASSGSKRARVNLFSTKEIVLPESLFGKPVTVANRPSIESFLTNHFQPRIPAKLQGCMEHWPALEKWKDIDYILEKMGPRTVPVEIGSSYASNNWSQKLMTVRSFIENFMLSDENGIGYLAQHQLFNQIPELLNDIREPEYCVLSDNYENTESGTDVNAWFGPAHTVSPLHYDPKHNLLAQVVGIKRVVLVHPKWSRNVYPYDDHLLHNTARVNPEEPDFANFPKFQDVECVECILEPGEMLYIPPKWWHHVRSLSASFSVSFWWK